MKQFLSVVQTFNYCTRIICCSCQIDSERNLSEQAHKCLRYCLTRRAVSESQTPCTSVPDTQTCNFNASDTKCSGNCQTIETVWPGTYCLTHGAVQERQTEWYKCSLTWHAISMLQISNVRDTVTLADLITLSESQTPWCKCPRHGHAKSAADVVQLKDSYTRLVIQTRLRISLENT